MHERKSNCKGKSKSGDSRDMYINKLDGSHPVKGWQPTTRELLSESWEIAE